MTLPAATLDHVVINARDDMDRAADIYTRLGFTLTERGYHSLGSTNHLAMSDGLSRADRAAEGRHDRPARPAQLSVRPERLVFGSEDSAITYAALHKAGLPFDPPSEFTRPVKYTGGQGDARFRTISHEGGRRALRPHLLLPSLHARPRVARRVAPSRQTARWRWCVR